VHDTKVCGFGDLKGVSIKCPWNDISPKLDKLINGSTAFISLKNQMYS